MIDVLFVRSHTQAHSLALITPLKLMNYLERASKYVKHPYLKYLLTRLKNRTLLLPSSRRQSAVWPC
jgi:hypothetical protein